MRHAEQSAGIGVWDIDIASDTVRGTAQFFRIMGLEPTNDPVPMRVLRGLRLDRDRERVNDGYRTAVETRTDEYESEYRIRRSGDGAERWILGRGRVVRDAGGAPVRYTGVDVDITERKAIDRTLAESEARLRIAIDAAQLGIWDWNVVTNEMNWSGRAKAIAGLPLDMPVSFEQIRDITHPDDLPRTSDMARRALDPAIRSREPYEYRLLRPDGSIRWVLAHGEARFVEPDDGPTRAERYIGTLQDITERKNSEMRLQESEATLRLAVDAARLAIWEINSLTGTLTATPELNRILGFPPDHVPQIDEVNARYAPGELERVQAAGAAALAAGERYFEAEFVFLGQNESRRWLLLRAEILFAADGKTPSGALGVLMDITAEKSVEEDRRLLLAELQHRVNNTLAVVGAIAKQTFSNAPPEAAFDIFSERLSALGNAHGMLAQQSWLSAELGAVTASALAPFQRERFSADGPLVQLASRQVVAMALALNELATNATKYGALSEPGGRVVIEWQVREDDDGKAIEWQWRESGGPTVGPPKRTSFGTRLIRDKLAADFNGEVELAYPPEGVVCRLRGRVDAT